MGDVFFLFFTSDKARLAVTPASHLCAMLGFASWISFVSVRAIIGAVRLSSERVDWTKVKSERGLKLRFKVRRLAGHAGRELHSDSFC